MSDQPGLLIRSNDNLIGGSTVEARNVIANGGTSFGDGIQLDTADGTSPTGNQIQGNFIGTDVTGTIALGFGIGVDLGQSTSNTQVGGPTTTAGMPPGNVISGNIDSGIVVSFSVGSASNNNIIQGNLIGTDATGTSALGNSNNGIRISGGSIGNLISANGIAFNGFIGIDLNGNGVTMNDHCDGDTGGANNLQNYPVITSASFGAGQVTVSGTLESNANSGFRLEFFSSPACDPLGFGEGAHFLGSTDITTGADCTVNFGPLTFPLPTGHTVVTATATRLDTSGNPIETSEFSHCAALPVATGAASRKTHGAAGDFDVNLPFTGTPGIECRTTGGTNDFIMVVTFANNVIVTGNPQAQVTMGVATIGSGGVSNGGMVTVSGNVVTIPLTLVTNQQTINVRLNGVNGGSDQPTTDVTIPMSLLIGDANANGAVNASDVSLSKARLGQAVGNGNFRTDVNANGVINAADVAIVKSHLGEGVP